MEARSTANQNHSDLKPIRMGNVENKTKKGRQNNIRKGENYIVTLENNLVSFKNYIASPFDLSIPFLNI